MMEEINAKYIKNFNDKTNFFKEITQNKQYSTIDFSGIDKKDRKCNIELKIRTNDIFKFDEIFIEERKYNELMKQYNESGIIPLYINFFQDDKHISIWNLLSISNPEKTQVVILDKGDNQTKLVTRLLLPTRYCSYFEFNTSQNKYIRKWQYGWQTKKGRQKQTASI